MSAHADMSHKCDKKSSRTFQRNFSEEKFLSEGPQSDCNRREGPSLSVSLRDTEIHSSCAQLTHKEFRALRSATKGSAFGIRKPFEKGLIENFVPWCASKGMFKVVSAKAVTAHSPAPAGSVAVKLHSDGRNATSPYLCYVGDNLPYSCYVDIEFRCVPEPSPRGEGVADRRRMRCARAEGAGECAKATCADITPSAPFHHAAQIFTSAKVVIAAPPTA